ncbi:MAG: hypothetical protein KIS92_24990 [Planctomycetota bacterium]|nr:hypothetical protein [Planctomycetota bacterium]
MMEFWNSMDPEQQRIMGDALRQMLLVTTVGTFLILIIHVLIAWIMMKCFEAIPKQYHQVGAWQVWITVLPCINVIWHFLTYPQLSRSFRRYFEAQGRTDVGDCGERKGMYFAISYAAANVIPCIGLLIAVYALIVQVEYLKEVWKARKLALQEPPRPDPAQYS